MRFSANLGFLWQELALPQAIAAAKHAGFDAVECHWPFDVAPDLVNSALAKAEFSMLALNTKRGAAGAMGLAAVPHHELGAKTHIDEAIDYGAAIGVANVHVMAGNAEGAEAERCFIRSLRYACEQAGPKRTILIEPLNHYDAPDYFLSTTKHALRVIDAVAAPNLKLMFDCYHVQIMEGDVCRRFSKLLPHIGHVQIAAVPDRGAPDHGELNYEYVLKHMLDGGYMGFIGAEYRVSGATENSLAWLKQFQK